MAVEGQTLMAAENLTLRSCPGGVVANRRGGRRSEVDLDRNGAAPKGTWSHRPHGLIKLVADAESVRWRCGPGM